VWVDAIQYQPEQNKTKKEKKKGRRVNLWLYLRWDIRLCSPEVNAAA
jgi:hypothetical protein